MGTYIARRLLLMIPTLVGITFLVFMIIALAPGGIGAALKASGGTMQSQKSVALMEAYLEDRYGLDDPAPMQYLRWLARVAPIKFGTRDQFAPSGEYIRTPKAVKQPPVWRWYAASLPSAPSASLAIDAGASPEQRIEAYRRAERGYADARSAYIADVTLLRQALAAYAREADEPSAIQPDGMPKLSRLGRLTPDESLPAFAAVREAGTRAVGSYTEALAARADLRAAFDAGPYPRAGVPIIPGVLSVAWPDLGTAYSKSRPVKELIKERLPVTLLINLIAIPIIYLIAIPGGMLAAIRKDSFFDVGLGAAFIVLYSVPTVLAGVLAIGFLASRDYLGAFPVSGLHANNAGMMTFLPARGGDGSWSPGWLADLLWHVCLPVLCLVYAGFAILSKQTRAAMLDNFSADYVRTAKAKGVSNKDVIFRHVFRNSLIPLITIFVTVFPAMLAGSVVIEKIFTVPGMGSLMLESIALRDREILLANTLMIAAVNLVALLAADILYALADPRVSYS